MRLILTLGLACYLHRSWGQRGTGRAISVPSLDDIMRSTSSLENAVLDLAPTDVSGPQDGFPSLGQGQSPGTPNQGEVGLGLPNAQDRTNSIFHVSNVHRAPGAGAGTGRFDDLAAIGNAGLGFTGGLRSGISPLNAALEPPTGVLTKREHAAAPHDVGHTPNDVGHMSSGVSGTDGFMSSGDGFLSPSSGMHSDLPHEQTAAELGSVHVDLPGQHGNPVDGAPVIHREGSVVGMGIAHTGNTHVDLPGQHGNPIDGPPVIHREGSVVGMGITHAGNTHVDLPGQHGNPIDGAPVIHREGTGMVGGGTAHAGNTHVDLPGQHGNPVDGMPVVHREGQHAGSAPSGGLLGHGLLPGTQIGSVHVDMPGEHGNPIDGVPVIHREGTPLNQGQQLHGHGTGNVHVDLPGQHGNPLDSHPVVHREGPATGIGHGGTPVGNVHVDMPGQHGNPVGGMPVVHRENSPSGNPALGNNLGGFVDSVHVDLPGEHGNPIDGVPVIHREGPTHHGGQSGNVHVDMPGQHGNPLHGEPVVHRETGVVTGSSVGTQHEHMDIHIDAPGEHGNQLNEPALHLPPGATIEDAIAAGVIPLPEGFGQQQTPQATGGSINAGPVNGGFAPGIGPSEGFGPAPAVGPVSGGFAPGIGPSEGFGPVPVGVASPGLTPVVPPVSGGFARGMGPIEGFGPVPVGVASPGLTPVVPTGVLPGSPNVPVPVHHAPGSVNHHVATHGSGNVHLTRPGRGQSLGDMLGIPSITLDRAVPIARFEPDLQPTDWGVVDGSSVLTGRAGGRPSGGLGRIRWRRRRRGGRGRGPPPTIIPTTTTTTKEPGYPGSGITIIRSSRPNPLGVLGDALRSALFGGGSSGVGLLGSLVRSALGASLG